MRSGLVVALVALTVGLAVGSADAKPCRARCRKAIAICTRKHCAQYHGPLKAGCKRGFRIELIGSCKAAPDAQICETFAADGCSN